MTNSGQFKPGQSGNPKGRPPGSKNRATLAAQELLDGEMEGLIRKCVQLALSGNPMAMRLCLERLVPPRRERTIEIGLPATMTLEDAGKASAAIIQAVAQGELTPGEGEIIGRMLETHWRALAFEDIEARLAALEQARRGG